MNEYLTELALRYPCQYCVAPTGTWCRTLSGAKATMLHSVRTEGVRLAWLDGWTEGAGVPKEPLLLPPVTSAQGIVTGEHTYTFNPAHTVMG